MDHIYNGILLSQGMGEMRGDERLPFSSPQPKKKKKMKKKKKNLRARRKSPGRQDRVAAGPFLVRRRRLRRRPASQFEYFKEK